MDYSINDRLKEARFALNLSQRGFFLKAGVIMAILGPIEMKSMSVL
jgi:hypothetical protein